MSKQIQLFQIVTRRFGEAERTMKLPVKTAKEKQTEINSEKRSKTRAKPPLPESLTFFQRRRNLCTTQKRE
jgi:hypothetical protein